jgi:type IV pilus assembly protein PilM
MTLPPSLMAFSLRNSSSRSSVGLDIDGRFLAAVESDGGRISRLASTELPDGLVRDGEVADADGLASALKEFASRTGLPKRVRLGVANQQIVVRAIDLPPIEDKAERDAAVRFQAAEAIAMPLDEAVLDYQIAAFEQAGDGAQRMRVVLVAARRAMVEAFVVAAKKAGLKPDGIDLDAFALMRVLADDAGEDARVYCHLAAVTNLAIGVGSSCLFTRPLATVWDSDHAAAQLADEIRLSIDYYMAQLNARPVGEALLSGPGSRDPELVDSLATHLGLPTSVATPLGRLDVSHLESDEDPHRFTVAAGLALEAAA